MNPFDFAQGKLCSVEMLAPRGEQEGAELVMRNEGHGSGEEPGKQPSRTLRRMGERDVVKVGDGTGEVSPGRWSTAIVTNGISRRGEIQEEAG